MYMYTTQTKKSFISNATFNIFLQHWLTYLISLLLFNYLTAWLSDCLSYIFTSSPVPYRMLPSHVLCRSHGAWYSTNLLTSAKCWDFKNPATASDLFHKSPNDVVSSLCITAALLLSLYLYSASNNHIVITFILSCKINISFNKSSQLREKNALIPTYKIFLFHFILLHSF